MKAKALWHISPEVSEIKEQKLQEDGKESILIRSLFSLVSIGTERIVALGRVPQNIREQMQVPYMEGSFSLPGKYGYSLVGRVLRGPDNFRDKLIYVMHPHQDLAWVNVSSVYILAEEIPPQRAVLAGNLETAVNALWDSEISIGDTILIAGFGLIGALIAFLASEIPGVNVSVYEINETRRQLALQMGFNVIGHSFPPERFFDAAFNTTSDASALQFCIDSAGYEGQVTEVSFYGTNEATVKLGGSFHTARKRIVVSQVSHIPGKRLNRWNYERRKHLVFDLLKNSRYDSLISTIIPFGEAPALFERIRRGPIDEISVVLQYQ